MDYLVSCSLFLLHLFRFFFYNNATKVNGGCTHEAYKSTDTCLQSGNHDLAISYVFVPNEILVLHDISKFAISTHYSQPVLSARPPDLQVQHLGSGTGDAALLPGVAELFAEARRAGVHRADQRGSPAVPCHERSHR